MVSFPYLLTPLSSFLSSHGNWKSRCYKVIASSLRVLSPSTLKCRVATMTLDFHTLLIIQVWLWSPLAPWQHHRLFNRLPPCALGGDWWNGGHLTWKALAKKALGLKEIFNVTKCIITSGHLRQDRVKSSRILKARSSYLHYDTGCLNLNWNHWQVPECSAQCLRVLCLPFVSRVCFISRVIQQNCVFLDISISQFCYSDSKWIHRTSYTTGARFSFIFCNLTLDVAPENILINTVQQQPDWNALNVHAQT